MRSGAGVPPEQSHGQDDQATTCGRSYWDWCWRGELNPHAG